MFTKPSITLFLASRNKSRVCVSLATIAICSVLACSATRAADVPATVGALKDSGGKQMTKSEILKMFPGSTMHGSVIGAPTSTFQLKFMPNGEAVGEGKSSGGSTKITGKWGANDEGYYCQDLKTSAGTVIKGCFPYFLWNGRIFAAMKDERGQPVAERKLTH